MGEPLRVMIVEDEPMLAFQLEDEVIEAGFDVVGCAMSSAEALDLAHETRPDLVFMDVQLADGRTGIQTATDLSDRHMVVVFVTASANDVPDDLAGAVGLIEKPWSNRGMKAALMFLADALHDGVAPPPPASLRLAPRCQLDRAGLYNFA